MTVSANGDAAESATGTAGGLLAPGEAPLAVSATPRLSVTIIARNEERDLPDCLASVSFADEIVVVDSGSSDRTLEIARAAGAKVFENPWSGYGAQKAFALSKATGEWVLNLDADERCSPELRRELLLALAKGGHDAYSIPFETHLFGRRAHFGGFGGERHLRLFRRVKASYPPREVHEGVRVEGSIGRLREPIVHHPYESLEEYFEKFNAYTSAMAKERAQAGRFFSAWSVFRWPWGFFRRYVLQLGFLDGYAGFLHASLSGLYDFVKYAKLDDYERSQRRLPERKEP